LWNEKAGAMPKKCKKGLGITHGKSRLPKIGEQLAAQEG
jgi:hypothetical protein